MEVNDLGVLKFFIRNYLHHHHDHYKKRNTEQIETTTMIMGERKRKVECLFALSESTIWKGKLDVESNNP